MHRGSLSADNSDAVCASDGYPELVPIYRHAASAFAMAEFVTNCAPSDRLGEATGLGDREVT